MKTLTTTIYRCEHCSTTRLSEAKMRAHEQKCYKNLTLTPACLSCMFCLEDETTEGTVFKCNYSNDFLFSYEQEKHRLANRLPLALRSDKYLMLPTCGNHKTLAQLTA